MTEPQTKAGRRLLAEQWDNFNVKPWGSLADHVAAIEREAEENGFRDGLHTAEHRVMDHVRFRHDGTVHLHDVLAAIRGERP